MLNLVPRETVMEWMGYKSIGGFMRFVASNKDFPAPIKRIKKLNAKVYFSRDAVNEYMQSHDIAYKDAMFEAYKDYVLSNLRSYFEKSLTGESDCDCESNCEHESSCECEHEEVCNCEVQNAQ